MKLQSTLPQRVFFIHFAVVLNVLILVFVMTLASSYIESNYGYGVKVPSSRFMMNVTGTRYVLSVTAGENPVFFLNNKRVTGGLPMLRNELGRIAGAYGEGGGSRTTIILYFDRAVSHGMEQELINLILEKGMNCAVAARPDA